MIEESVHFFCWAVTDEEWPSIFKSAEEKYERKINLRNIMKIHTFVEAEVIMKSFHKFTLAHSLTSNLNFIFHYLHISNGCCEPSKLASEKILDISVKILLITFNFSSLCGELEWVTHRSNTFLLLVVVVVVKVFVFTFLSVCVRVYLQITKKMFFKFFRCSKDLPKECLKPCQKNVFIIIITFWSIRNDLHWDF